MPPTLNVSYTANYTDTEIGAATATAADVANAIGAGRGLQGAAEEIVKDRGVII